MSKDDEKTTGMNCFFCGTVLSEPKTGTTKRGHPSTSLIIRYEEYSGETKICLVNRYGKDAPALAAQIHKGQEVRVEGNAIPNIRVKDGKPEPALLVTASKITISESDENDEYQQYDDRHF